jgi:hypothetical protein
LTGEDARRSSDKRFLTSGTHGLSTAFGWRVTPLEMTSVEGGETRKPQEERVRRRRWAGLSSSC